MSETFQYPSLKEAIEALESRKGDVSDKHATLINKWIIELEKVNKEMRHLERIESLTSALTINTKP